MSSHEEFAQKIDESQRRLEWLARQGAEEKLSDPLLKSALEELQVLSEELLVADAELREQNDELIRTREVIEAERKRYQDLFEFAPDGYLVTDHTGKIREANRSASRLLNVEARFLITKPLATYIAREDRYEFRKHLRRLGSPGPEMARIEDLELRLQPRHREALFVSLTAQGGPDGIRWLIRDIRQRKQMQSELAEVQTHLVEGREQERLGLAKQLHDGPLQDLYGLVFKLNLLAYPGEQNGNQEEIANLQHGLQDVIDTLRSLLGDMRPPSLTPFGLEKAILSHAENFQTIHPDLKIYLDLIPDRQTMPENMRLALFRIYQQVMVNLVDHAQASQAWVRLTFDDQHQVRLEVQDNGRGFEVPRNWLSFVRQGRLGLARAAEKAAAIGGKLSVESEPGKGTTIQVTAPLPD